MFLQQKGSGYAELWKQFTRIHKGIHVLLLYNTNIIFNLWGWKNLFNVTKYCFHWQKYISTDFWLWRSLRHENDNKLNTLPVAHHWKNYYRRVKLHTCQKSQIISPLLCYSPVMKIEKSQENKEYNNIVIIMQHGLQTLLTKLN